MIKEPDMTTETHTDLPMTEEQIKHMVDRFLFWKLPENFNPDGGISFKKTFNEHMPFGPTKYEPSGTNLFDAAQADAMVRHMVDGMPVNSHDALVAALREIANHPEEYNDGKRSYAVGWAFWNVQKIARAALYSIGGGEDEREALT